MIKHRALKLRLGVTATIVAIFAVILTISNSVQAASEKTIIMEKAMLAGLSHCISKTYLNEEVYLGEHDLILRDNFSKAIFTKDGRKEDEDSVKLPTQIGNTIKDSAVGCAELLLGYNGIFTNDLTGFQLPADVTIAAKWMKALGYKKKVSESLNNGETGNKCVHLEYKLNSGSSYVTQKTAELCFEVESNGEVKRENNQILVTPSTKETATSGNVITFEQMGGSNMVRFTTGCTYKDFWTTHGATESCHQSSLIYPLGMYDNLNITEMANDLPNVLKNSDYKGDNSSNDVLGLCKKGTTGYCQERYDMKDLKLVSRDASDDETENNSNYYTLDLSNAASVKNGATKYFSNSKFENTSAAAFTTIDRYNDYTYTLFNLFEIKTDSGAGCKTKKKDLPNTDLAVKLIDKNGKKIWVQLEESSRNAADSKQLLKNVNGSKNKDVKGKAYVIKKTDNGIVGNPVDVKTIISYLNSLDLSTETDVSGLTAVDAETCIVDGVADLPTDYDPSTGDEKPKDGEVSKCFDLNAGGSLGWIVCPILEGAAEAVKGLYDMMIEPFLKIEAGIMAMSQTDATGNEVPTGTYEGWKIFQNMANIAAIIFLLVLIFSQVTGVGIDNYGIKKALPKVIIALILINLSFIICQAAVDLSNVLGKGLKDMFNGLGQQISEYTIPTEDGSGIGATLGTTAIIVGLVGLLIYFPGVTAALAMAVLPALLGGVISALIAVLMLFVLLTARKIAVIVLVILSPLAVVCYMLPNTKKLFDKWLLFLKNMLLMFPICGIVIGGGDFISRVILTSGEPSFINALAALAAGIVPFFFVPTLLKGSMNILGNIGTKLSGFGKNMSHRASGAVNNSDRMRDIQKRLSMARNQKVFDRYQKRLDKGKTLSGYQQRRMNNARLAYNTAAREDIDAAAGGSILRGQALAAAKQEETIKQEEKAIAEQATLISTASGFDKENGSDMYRQAKAARAAADAARRAGNTAEAEIQDHRADAYIDLAGRTGKSASQFANALRNDTGHELSEKSAKRIMNGEGSKMFKATDGVAFQYAREVYNGDAATKGQTKVDTWTGDNANIRKAVEKNINNQESYSSQSADVLKLLNSNMTDIRSSDANMADELEYFAAGAIENSSDLSKSAEYKAMQNGRQTREREAQAAQTAAQVGAAAAQTAAINAQAQQNFESQHMMNAELKQQRTKSTTFDIPEGYTPDLTRPGMYKNSSGRHYDPTKNKFF